jgi:translation initiation factor eIF-2B subunit delta
MDSSHESPYNDQDMQNLGTSMPMAIENPSMLTTSLLRVGLQGSGNGAGAPITVSRHNHDTDGGMNTEGAIFEEILRSPSYSRSMKYSYNTQHNPRIVQAPISSFKEQEPAKIKLEVDTKVKPDTNTDFKKEDNDSGAQEGTKKKKAQIANPPTSAAAEKKSNSTQLTTSVSAGPVAPSHIQLIPTSNTSASHTIVPGLPTTSSILRPQNPGQLSNTAHIHPSISRLGKQYAQFKIIGSNARCRAMLQAFKDVIADYKTPSKMVLNRHMDTHLKPQINYIVSCRPLSISMGNAIRALKCRIASLSPDIPEQEAKDELVSWIDDFIKVHINVADRAIADYCASKINDQDVILIYAKSEVVLTALCNAYSGGKRFRVIIVDSRPWFEGKASMKVLIEAGIPVTYILINAVGYVMDQVTKIILGAHCVYSNGTVQSRAGTCLIAMSGYSAKVPVIVCCEIYKFSDHVQLAASYRCEHIPDARASTLLSKPSSTCNNTDLPSTSTLPKQHQRNRSQVPAGSGPSNIHISCSMYDITPSKLISMIISEIGMIPCTSIPVVIREYRSQG